MIYVGRSYFEVLISNLIIIIMLIPMVIMLNACIAYDSNPLGWIVLGFMLLGIWCYIQYKRENSEA